MALPCPLICGSNICEQRANLTRHLTQSCAQFNGDSFEAAEIAHRVYQNKVDEKIGPCADGISVAPLAKRFLNVFCTEQAFKLIMATQAVVWNVNDDLKNH